MLADAKPYHLGVNWPTTHGENKNEMIHFFTFENRDIAWRNKHNSEEKEKKEQNVSFKKKKKRFWKKRVFLNPENKDVDRFGVMICSDFFSRLQPDISYEENFYCISAHT